MPVSPTVKLLALLCLAGIASRSSAQDEDGFFIGLFGGAAWSSPVVKNGTATVDPLGWGFIHYDRDTGQTTPLGLAESKKYDYAIGKEVSLTAGYRLDFGDYGAVRLGGEFGSRFADLRRVQVHLTPAPSPYAWSLDEHDTITTTSGADRTILYGLANLAYEVPTPMDELPDGLAWHPLVGLGFGVERAHGAAGTGTAKGSALFDSVPTNFPSATFQFLPGTITRAVWQAEVGVTLSLGDGFALAPMLRRFQSFDARDRDWIARAGLLYSF